MSKHTHKIVKVYEDWPGMLREWQCSCGMIGNSEFQLNHGEEAMSKEGKHLIIHAITEKGDGHVTKWLSVPLAELDGGELPIHINMFNQDVVLNLSLTEGDDE